MLLTENEKLSLIDKVILNRYKITKWFKDGGLSSLFYIQDKEQLDKKLIVKVVKINFFSKDWNNKFFDELQIFHYLKFKNSNIIKIENYSLDENYFYLIQENFESISLDEYIEKNFPISLEISIHIILQIINGIKILHNNEKKIIHRDLKPQNILIDKQLNIKIIDFGISSIITNNNVLTNEQDLFCSSLYTSNEILKLSKNIRSLKSKNNHTEFGKIVNFQIDIHSIGVIWFQILTGLLPFKQMYDQLLNDKQKIELWNHYDIPNISNIRNDVPKTIDYIIYKATASKSNNISFRYKNINELEEEILNYQNINLLNFSFDKTLEDDAEQKLNKEIFKYKKINLKLIISFITLFIVLLIVIVICYVVQ